MLRKVDRLGRVVLPEAYRQALCIKENEEIEMILKTDEIIIKKPVFGCVFCNMTMNLVRINTVCVFRFCIERLYNAKDHDVLYPIRTD